MMNVLDWVATIRILLSISLQNLETMLVTTIAPDKPPHTFLDRSVRPSKN